MSSLNAMLVSSPGPVGSVPAVVGNGLKLPTAKHPSDVSGVMELCTSIKQLKQVHAHLLRTGLFFDPFSSASLVAGAALSPFSSLGYARQVFDQIPEPNLYTWNTLIRSYASSPDPSPTLVTFLRMLHQCPVPPNKFTFPCIIKAASESDLASLRVGKAFHGMAIKGSLGSDVYILNSLIHFYAARGDLAMAHRVFDSIPHRDVVSWNSIIHGLAKWGFPEQALELFGRMEVENVRPNNVTMVGVVSACGKKSDLELGRWFHSYIERNEISFSSTLYNALLDMYTKCGSIEDAKNVFDKMPARDIYSCTTMIAGYAKSGDHAAARRTLDAMPCHDITAWNALISAYQQSGKPKEALAVFHELQLHASMRPDEVTLVSALSACAQLGVIDLGRWIHAYIMKHEMNFSCQLTTSLLDMYAKGGDIVKAVEVFHLTEQKDVFVWSAMIAGLAMHGRGRDAIDLFFKMQEAEVPPNGVTFTNLLSACSHAGLVEEGRLLMNQMEPVYGVVPTVHHYTCMVDILGRAGLLEEAMEFIEKMQMVPNVSIWKAMLGACKMHGSNAELAERAAACLLELDPRNHGAYVLVSNVYAKMGKWEEVSRLRKIMRDSGLKKEVGCSTIEVKGVIHEFLAGDNSHPQAKKIYSKLDEIAARLKTVGYVPDRSQLLQLVQEEDKQEHALYLHSEKLAIAFGLLVVPTSQPIRIVKNLRVCGDCHAVAKLVSELYNSEIILRDRYRFHHFKGGHCSCMDYW